jgi:dephospho-CoA kinase
VLVVSAPRFLQRSRVLARPGMDPVKLDRILVRQMPDALKRRLADYIVPTGLGRAVTFRYLTRIVAALQQRGGGHVWPPHRLPRDRMPPFLSRWKKPHA